MSSSIYQANPGQVIDLLHRWLARQLSGEPMDWLNETQNKIAAGDKRLFYMAFSMVPRHTGKAELSLMSEDLEEAKALRTDWVPHNWTLDQVGRVLLVLSFPHEFPEAFVKTLDRLFKAADVMELIALYQSLPLLPHPEHHRPRATEGIRSNLTSVFNAVALDNPYPSEYLEEDAWNQLVLKALFIESPLHPIVGLDRRANAELARMLIDYAHERWAAQRVVPPELWRPVGRFADHDTLQDFRKVLEDPDPKFHEAAALALAQCSLPEAKTLLSLRPEVQRVIEAGELDWNRYVQSRLLS